MVFLALALIVVLALSDEDCCIGCIGMLLIVGFLWWFSSH